MRILGIDPGTACTGYGVVTGDDRGAFSLVECGVIRTGARDPLASRLRAIFDGITELIARHEPDALAVEDIFYAKNVRTTVVLGHARGVILLAGEQRGLAIYELPPATIKKAVVGTGIASKQQVQFMIARILRLRSVPEPTDAADGVAAALACLMEVRIPSCASGQRLAPPAAPRAASL